MTKATYWMTGALVLVMGTAGVAWAKGGPDGAGMQQMFEQFDTDNDGKITQAELDAAKAARFAEADTDGDGFLSAEEMAAYTDKMRAEREARMREARGQAMFRNLDIDGDGKLSAEEAAARGPGMMIQRFDADKDGAVSLEEMQQARGMMGRHGGEGHGERDGRGWGKHAQGHGHGDERGHNHGGKEGRTPWWLR